MAEGEFVALLDHDDLLRSDALVEVVRALNEFPNTEFLYSDEDKLFADGSYDHSYAKSGWSPDLHLSYNYICHFAVINKALIMRLGGWRQGFDGAQITTCSFGSPKQLARSCIFQETSITGESLRVQPPPE